MGYTTEFYGGFKFEKDVPEWLMHYINVFSDTRRMKRDNKIIKQIYPDWEKYCYKGNLGVNGEYFAHDDGIFGQNKDDSIIDYSNPSEKQPGLWCHWVCKKQDDSFEIQWDEGEKFYNYVEWLQYIIKEFISPEGLVLNGAVFSIGEDSTDAHYIIVSKNVISVYDAYPDDSISSLKEKFKENEVVIQKLEYLYEINSKASFTHDFSSLWLIDSDLNGKKIKEFKDSYLFLPCIFRILAEKYLGMEESQFILFMKDPKQWEELNKKISLQGDFFESVCWELANQQIFQVSDCDIVAKCLDEFSNVNADNLSRKEKRRIERIAVCLRGFVVVNMKYFVFKASSIDDLVSSWFDKEKGGFYKTVDNGFVQISKHGKELYTVKTIPPEEWRKNIL